MSIQYLILALYKAAMQLSFPFYIMKCVFMMYIYPCQVYNVDLMPYIIWTSCQIYNVDIMLGRCYLIAFYHSCSLIPSTCSCSGFQPIWDSAGWSRCWGVLQHVLRGAVDTMDAARGFLSFHEEPQLPPYRSWSQ